MSVFNRVSVGVKSKYYTHHLPFDNNTTMQFGVVQPLYCQYLNADDSISLSARQLVRLAPLPVPTFGRMRLQNNVRFVKANDVCPFYEALLSSSYVNSTHKSYQPTRLPWISLETLTVLLLKYCVFSVYQSQRSSGKEEFIEVNTPSIVSQVSNIVIDLTSHSYLSDVFTPQYQPGISFDGADYIVKSDDGSLYFCFRFTNAAKRLRSILIGLGYSFDLSNASDKLSVLPILAYYKAYYDTYSPSRESNWLQTACFRLINFMYDYNFTEFGQLFYSSSNKDVTSSIQATALQFIDDLINTWYVEPVNYVSAHRVTTGSNLAARMYNPEQLDFDDAPTDVVGFSDSSLPNAVLDPQSEGISSIALRQVMKLSRFVTKDSVIGKKVSDWLKVHFGADVEQSFFKDSSNIADFSVNCSINDVFSTSDTLSSDGTGETLGAYAGKGLGFNDSSFKYKAPTFGFVIHLATIVPDSNFFQGYDPTLYATTAEQLPSAELDALGYEVTPLGSIFPNNDIELGKTNMANSSFGFLPRFSSFKTKKDIINGDMSRRGTISSFAPYYLDKILTQQLVHASKVSDKAYEVVDFKSSLPLASEAWRYTCKFPWLGNYNRIFTAGNYNDYSLHSDPDTDNYYTEQIIDDLFIVQSVFDMRLSNHLRPMSESYDTFDDDVNGDNTTIQKPVN